MSTRDAMGFPTNPSDGQLHEGWEWDGDKWVAVGSEIDANIEGGTADGQITTWAGDKWSPNDAVTVDNTGNVGIGADSPTHALHVKDPAGKTGSVTAVKVENNDSSVTGLFCAPNSGFSVPGLRNSTWIQSSEALHLSGGGATNAHLTIDSSGDATFSGKVTVAEPHGQTLQGGRIYLNRPAANYITALDPASQIVFQVGGEDIDSNVLSMNASGNATFNGSVLGTAFETSGEVSGSHYSLGPNKFTEADTGTEIAYYGITLDTADEFWSRISGFSGVAFYTQGQKRLAIDTNGDATFSGKVTAGNMELWNSRVRRTGDNGSGLYFLGSIIRPIGVDGAETDGVLSLGSNDAKFKDGFFSGSVTSTRMVQDGSPVIDAKGLINTLSTLRNATKDETTLEGMRDALADAIGGIIQDLEHQISTMTAEDSNE